MPQQSLATLARLFSESKAHHGNRSASIISNIHNLMSQDPSPNPLSGFEFEAAFKLFRQTQNGQAGTWGQHEQKEEMMFEKQVCEEAQSELAAVEQSIRQLEGQIKQLSGETARMESEKQQLGQKLLKIEGQFLTRQGQSQNVGYHECLLSGTSFSLTKDENGKIYFDGDYLRIMQHLQKRNQSNQALVKYYRSMLEKRYMEQFDNNSAKAQRQLIMREKALIQEQLKEANDQIANYQQKMTKKVRNYEQKVNERMNDKLAKALEERRPEKERHQRAYSEIHQLIKKKINSAELAQIEQVMERY